MRTSLIAVAVAAALATPAVAQAFRIDYVVDAGVEHDDNVQLAAVDPDSQRILRTGVGFVATQEGSTVQAVVAGRGDYRNFDHGVDDGVEGVLSAYLNWVMIDERLSFSIQDELELQAIDRFAADSPDNRQQVNVLSLGPNFLFNIGDTLQGRLEARYIDTHAEVTDEFDSNRIGAAVRVAKAFDANSSLGLNAQWTDVDYDQDLSARDHERADLYAHYIRAQANTDYAIDVGYSRLDYADGERSSGPLLRLEAGWRPGERSRLALTLVDQFSDAADTSLVEGVAGRVAATIPEGVLVDDSAVIASAYREKRVTVAWAYSGERLGWRVEPYAQRLRYLDAQQPDEDVEGVLLGFDYRFGADVTLRAWAGSERVEYTHLGAQEDTRRAGVSLEKQWTRHWSSAISYTRYERDSDLLDDVHQNVWYLWMSYRNRPR
ncbi:hypothetical protein [Luteimonas sp. MC1825]|uniref:hypothetical protein n=1 Tax=Luteimonas sp. MC1825 TaxID=2761107 RepID=UPI0016130F5C|nr:hypothetical protein [Luteimonas sp. MC1825]MBB6598938.1 hypothetical protein [Luteimonas sp. MC1825]QOC89080.1 hypothetical protein IDM46_04960 [Luteimonas sp. MC1825]